MRPTVAVTGPACGAGKKYPSLVTPLSRHGVPIAFTASWAMALIS